MNYQEFEYELYQHIFNEADCLWKYELYSKIIDPNTVNNNAQFLTYKLKAFFDVSKLPDINNDLEYLYKLYDDYSLNLNGEKTRYPDRFPIMFDSQGAMIEHCLIRFENAISSVNLKSTKLVIPIGTLSKENLSVLKKQKIPLYRNKYINSEGYEVLRYSLYRYWLAENFGEECQIRRKTGFGFKASFTTNLGKIASNAGFYLFNQSFEVDVINFKLRQRKSAIEYITIDGLPDIEIRPSK
jgi:hypothetical protein